MLDFILNIKSKPVKRLRWTFLKLKLEKTKRNNKMKKEFLMTLNERKKILKLFRSSYLRVWCKKRFLGTYYYVANRYRRFLYLKMGPSGPLSSKIFFSLLCLLHFQAPNIFVEITAWKMIFEHLQDQYKFCIRKVTSIKHLSNDLKEFEIWTLKSQ